MWCVFFSVLAAPGKGYPFIVVVASKIKFNDMINAAEENLCTAG